MRKTRTFSLKKRLIALLLLFLVTVMLCVTLVLYITGVFNVGKNINKMLFKRELLLASRNINDHFGKLTIRSISMSKKVTELLEKQLNERHLQPIDLQDRPEVLHELLSATFDPLIEGLRSSVCTGVFLILDATVNPCLENAEFSKAGLYFKNTEPNAVDVNNKNIRYMRGPAELARKEGLTMLPQWTMEFDVNDADYFNTPVQTAKKGDLSLSQLYYWCLQSSVDGYNTSMFCSVPLIASDGSVLGTVGFETDQLLFKYNYAPDNSAQSRIFCMLSFQDSDHIEDYDMGNAMFAGNYSFNDKIPKETARIHHTKSNLNRYTSDKETVFLGLHCPIRIDADNPYYKQGQWVVAVLAPEEDVKGFNSEQNQRIISVLVVLTACFAAISFLFSNKYYKPIRQAVNTLESKPNTPVEKTGISEIDRLVEVVSKQNQPVKNKKLQGQDTPVINIGMFETFLQNTKTLSTAEKAVYDLYMKGLTANEIADSLHLSINTIKTHTKRIYGKLNVSSRRELLLYAQMMENYIK